MSRESMNGPSRQQTEAKPDPSDDTGESLSQTRRGNRVSPRRSHPATPLQRVVAGTRYLFGPFRKIIWLEMGVPSSLVAVSYVLMEEHYDTVRFGLITGAILLVYSPYFLFRRFSKRHRIAHFTLTVASLAALIVLLDDPYFVSSTLYDIFILVWMCSSMLLFISSVIAIPLHILPRLRSRKTETQGASPSEAVRSVIDSLKAQFKLFNESAVREQMKLADTLTHIQEEFDSRLREAEALDYEVERLRKKAEKYDEISLHDKYFRRNIVVGVVIGCGLLFIGGVLSPLLEKLGEILFSIETGQSNNLTNS